MAIGYDKALSALRGGGDRIMVTHPDPSKATERTIYALVSSGKAVSLPAYRKLAADLVPVADGLFGAEMAQTYEWGGQE